MHEVLVLSTDVYIDFALRGIWRNEHFHQLPARTWDIIEYLARRPNIVIAREQLLAVGWPGEPRVPDDLARHIRRIRHLLEVYPHCPRQLVTYRGVGYCLRTTENTSKN